MSISLDTRSQPTLAHGQLPERRVVAFILLLSVLFAFGRLAIYWIVAQPFGGLAKSLCQWDCGWYLSIVYDGYDLAPRPDPVGQANWAFLPLYPLTVRLATFLYGLNGAAAAAGIIISGLCCVAYSAISSIYVRDTRRLTEIVPWLLLATTWPTSFYNQSVYTESMYASLIMLCLLALHRNRILLAAIVAALASATRPPGILLSVAVAAHVLVAGTLAGRPSARKTTKLALSLAIAPLGLIAFMAFLQVHVGDALAFAHIQVAWYRTAGNPISRIWHAISSGDWDVFTRWRTVQPAGWCAVSALLGLAAAALLVISRRLTEAYLLAGTVLLAASTGVQSMPRFVFAHPVFLLAVYDVLRYLPQTPFLVALCALAAFQMLLVVVWFNGAVLLW
jgi:Gpi18-like mannosyltransferase